MNNLKNLTIDIHIKNIYKKIIEEIIDTNNFYYIFNDKEKLPTLSGIPSLILLINEMKQWDSSKDWDNIVYELLKVINYNIKYTSNNITTVNGLAGIGYCCLTSKINDDVIVNYNKKLNRAIIEKSKKYIFNNIAEMKMMENIYGLSGIGRYLLNFKKDNEIYSTIKLIIEYGNNLINIDKQENRVIPRWSIEMADNNKVIEEYYPMGVAHGICGVLSFLSLAIINGIEVEGQKKTIEEILKILYKFKLNNGDIDAFPRFFLESEYINSQSNNIVKNFNWCNGSLGIIRSIYLAGTALNNPYYIKDANDMILNICKIGVKNIDELGFISPTFCHGYSGLLSVLNSFKESVDDDLLNNMINITKKKILDFYEEENIFGFSNYEKAEDSVVKFQSMNIIAGLPSVLLPLEETISKNNKLWKGIYLMN